MMKDKVSKLCNILGSLIIGLIILTCMPMALPRLFGVQIFNIISGSMEPALPIGSAIYVVQKNPQEMQTGDVMAFWVEDEVVAHRVIKNEQEEHWIITKGDANAAEDRNPVSYENVIGKEIFHIPYLGNVLFIFSTKMGKVYLFSMLVAAVLLRMISLRLRHDEKSVKKVVKSKKEKLYHLIILISVTVFLILVIVVGMILKYMYRYQNEEKMDLHASNTYTAKETSAVDIKFNPDHCPISVDFEELQEINPEIVAWIYCEDSVIDYPVCHGADDEYYLSHSYDRKWKASGSIFLETANQPDFSDSNFILYGHHMKNKSMFATLSYWAEQEYYEAHPFMWLLTPEKTYRIDLFAGYVTDALSETYTVFQGYAEALTPYLERAWQQSDFEADLPEVKELLAKDEVSDQKFIVLSTCEYSFKNARYVLHGRLVEIEH